MKGRISSILNCSPLLFIATLLCVFCCACGEKNIAEKEVTAEAPAETPTKASTEQNFDELIIGSWKMTAFSIIDPNAGSMALDYAKNIAPTVKYVFKEGGEYELTSKTVQTPKKGTWQKGPNKNEVIIRMGNEARMLITLEKQEENHLWCRTQTPRMGDVTFQLLRIEE